VTYYGPAYWTGTYTYQPPSSSALVLRLAGDGISEMGRIAHENATVDRSLYIGDVLYTVSDTTVKASSMDTLELLGSITYSDGRTYQYASTTGSLWPSEVAGFKPRTRCR
jgi:hypothetical protein